MPLTVYIISVETEGMANDGLSEEQRAALAGDSNGQEFKLRRLGSMAQVVKLFIYALVLWTLKASLLYNFAIRLTVSDFFHRMTVGYMTEADFFSNRVMCLEQERGPGSVLVCS